MRTDTAAHGRSSLAIGSKGPAAMCRTMHAGCEVDGRGQRSGRGTREDLDVDAELGQPPRGLDDVDVHATGIAGTGLIKRRGVNAEHRHPRRCERSQHAHASSLRRRSSRFSPGHHRVMPSGALVRQVQLIPSPGTLNRQRSCLIPRRWANRARRV